MLLILSLLAAFATDVPSKPAPLAVLLESPTRHVRTSNPVIAHLLKMGAERSYTFEHLLRQLESTDICVYVEESRDLPHRVDGRLGMIPTAGPVRYVRVEIAEARGHDPKDAIALIGHELWHAIEVAGAPDVRDDKTLAALYQRIGERTFGDNVFDTSAARDTGRQVRRELRA